MLNLTEFLLQFTPLTNAHSNDFLICDLWNTFIPENMRDSLELLDDPKRILELYLSDTYDVYDLDVTPLVSQDWSSVLDPVSGVVSRDCRPIWSGVDGLSEFVRYCRVFSRLFKSEQYEQTGSAGDSNEKCMNEKKSYEIGRMGSFISEVCAEFGVDCVVDVGSGRGYLGSELSRIESVSTVVELEFREQNVESAQQRRLKCSGSGARPEKIVSMAVRIEPDTDIAMLLQAETVHFNHHLLTGLHCCGGLSVTMLRNFVRFPTSTSLVFVGCCYHFLEERFVNNFPREAAKLGPRQFDFPLSERLTRTGLVLGRNAKTLAAQSARKLLLAEGGPHKTMLYRIMLQQLLVDRLGFVSDDWQVGALSKKQRRDVDFVAYVRLARQRLGLDFIDKISDQELLHFEASHVRLRHRFSCFFYLRVCLSAMVEAIIVWDRLEFLRQQQLRCQVRVIELFEEIRSPRRFALLAHK